MNRSLICQTLDDTGNDNLERLDSIRFEFIKDRINNATVNNNTTNGNYLRIKGIADIVSGDWRYTDDDTKVVNGALKNERIYCITKGIIFITPAATTNVVGTIAPLTFSATNNAEDSLVFNIEELYKIPNNNIITVQFAATNKIETIKGDIDVLSKFTDLKQVKLINTSISGDIKAFSGLTNLSWLSLSNTNVSGDIKAFSGLTRLQSLSLSNTSISGDIKALSGLTNLQSLYMNNTNVSGDISSIMNLPNIKTVHLPNTITHTDEQVKTLTDKGITVVFR